MNTMHPIGFDDACALVARSLCAPLGKEHVFLHDAHNRVLAEDIFATESMPNEPRAMMDGYLLPASLVAESRASADSVLSFALAPAPLRAAQSQIPLENAQAHKIFTGAPIPAGDFVMLLLEDCEEREGMLHVPRAVLAAAKKGQYVREKGENYNEGDKLLARGITLGAAEIGLLASLNHVFVPVFVQPKVAILCGGDELVDLGEAPKGAHYVRSINNHFLAMLVREAGGIPLLFPLLCDKQESVMAAFFAALQSADMILFSGGMSVGDFDFVPHVLTQESDSLLFYGVRVKPGKPAAVAFKNGVPLCGLGGFPNSSFIGFHFFARPLLASLCGARFSPLQLRATLTEELHKNESRTEWRSCALWAEGERLYVGLGNRGKIHSAAINHLCGHSGFVRIDEQTTILHKDSSVTALIPTFSKIGRQANEC